MRLLWLSIILALASFVAGAFMMTSANPEVTFWLAVRDARNKELSLIRESQKDQPVIIFTGGSSCAFSVRPEIIEEITGYAAMNYGVAAGSGSKFIVEQALTQCRPGDILVLALEPHFLVQAGRDRPTQLGMSLAAASGDLALAVGGESFGDAVSPGDFSNFMRPGARYTATWVGKAIRGDLGYRYKIQDYRSGGWLESAYRSPPLRPIETFSKPILSQEGREFLQKASLAAEEWGVAIYYSLPWVFADSEIADEFRAEYHDYLGEISGIMPILQDGFVGAQTNADYFADTTYHLNGEGATLRSAILARSLVEVLPAIQED